MVHIPEHNIGHCPTMTTQSVTTANSLKIFEILGTSAVQEFAQYLCSITDPWLILNEMGNLYARRLLKANLHIPCRVHAALLPCCAVALRSHFPKGVVGARQGSGMGMGTAWYVWIGLTLATSSSSRHPIGSHYTIIISPPSFSQVLQSAVYIGSKSSSIPDGLWPLPAWYSFPL